MHSNMNKMMLSMMMLLLVATATFVEGQQQRSNTSLSSRMKALRQKKCGKCNKPDMKMLASLAKNKQVTATFNSLYSSSDITEMKNEIISVYEDADIGSSKDDDVLESAAVALFTSSQKKVQASLNQVERQDGPLGFIVTIGTIILTVLGAISAIIGIITPDSEIIALLDTITVILEIILGVVDFFAGFLGRGANVASSTSKEIAQFQSTFSDISCTTKSLQCQVNTLKQQADF